MLKLGYSEIKPKILSEVSFSSMQEALVTTLLAEEPVQGLIFGLPG